jgi:subtilisin family serine protease
MSPGFSRNKVFVLASAIALGSWGIGALADQRVNPATQAPTAFDVEEGGLEVRNGRAPVFVELSAASAAEVFVAERTRFFEANRFVMSGTEAEIMAAAEASGARAAFAAAAGLKQAHADLIDTLTRSHGAVVMYNARFAINGVAVLVAPERLDAIRALPGVAQVSPLVTQQVNAVSSIDFTGARSFWGTVLPDLNLRGANIGVGVIDTGIDHMHTSFGGPGGSAYAPGVTTATPFPMPPTVPVAANFPTPKVVWGYDYVGDAYNAGGTTDAALLPVPDPNSMDTNGHGTAVASLMAGFGANNNGSTYTGPWDRTAPNIFADLRISPGYSPQAALYAFRVFGTTGSTQVTASALDSATAIYLWQADTGITWDGAVTGTVFNQAGQPVVVNYTIPQPPVTPRLRVINLSLGSNAGDIEESSAIAAQRSADAGLLVVMSAGNADDSYYITGSPGVATGGISVAASFNNQFPGGVANAPANAAATPPQPALSGFAINNLGNASYSSAPVTFGLTDVVYARPAFGGRTAPAPAGYTPPGGDVGNLVTLVDPNGVDINLFSLDAQNNLVVTLNPAANNIYAGKVVLIDRGSPPAPNPSVGFHQKALAVQRAGGTAALIVNNTTGVGGMAANANLPPVTIPSAMIEQAVGASFTLDGSANLPAPAVERAGVQTRPGLQVSMTPFSQALQDTMAAYSSRGPRRNDDGIKPDITAPAENVSAASATTGNGVRSFNGTSSAAPHTAGALTLLRNLNPTWTNYELKASLLNNTGNDVFALIGANATTPPSGTIWGVPRQGVGRWDLSRYAGGGSKVILFAQDPLPTSGGVSRAGAVNVSFGTLDVATPTTVDRTVIVRNKGTTPQTFGVGYVAATDTPGVSYSFPDGNSISVPALGERVFRVRLTADPTAMRHQREAALRPFQFITNTNAANRVPRQFINEEAGYITLTPTGGSSATHRLTVQAFPRRASQLAIDVAAVNAGSTQTARFTGSAFNTGPNTAFVDATTFVPGPTTVDIVSFAKPFELAWESTEAAANVTEAQAAGDIRYVGVTSDFTRRTLPFDPATTANNSTVLMFGIATRGQFDTVQSGFGAEYQIDIDLNRDGTTDRMIRQFAFTNGERTTVTTNINLPVMSSTAPFTAGSGTGFFLNALSNVYTNTYNNNVVMIPVRVSGSPTTSMTLTEATSRFNYRVRGVHRGVQISQTPWLSYDVARPGIVVSGTDEPSLVTPVNTQGQLQSFEFSSNLENLTLNGSAGLLMLYPMNAPNARAQTFPITRPEGVFANGFEAPAP